VAHTIVVSAHQLLLRGGTDQERGANDFDERNTTAVGQRAVARIARLGYEVTLTPKGAEPRRRGVFRLAEAGTLPD
jgi:hypothetical protein